MFRAVGLDRRVEFLRAAVAGRIALVSRFQSERGSLRPWSGVLVECPVMLSLVWILLRSR